MKLQFGSRGVFFTTLISVPLRRLSFVVMALKKMKRRIVYGDDIVDNQ